MLHKVILCTLFAIAFAQRQQPQLPTHGVPATDDGDDGTWTEGKYDATANNELGGGRASPPQYQAQPAYSPPSQPRYQAPAPQQYSAPAPAPQQYSAPAPQPQYRPAPQQYRAPAPQQYSAPAPQPEYRPAPQQPRAPAPQQQYRPQKYSQGGDSRNAAILSEARYLQGDGKFGAAYTQEDGVEFKEESDADGTRRGTYSWVDPTGERRTVSYVAGKNGFQASGAHLPVAPAGPAAAAPAPAPQREYAPEPQYQPQARPQYQPEPQYQPQARPQYRQEAEAPPSNSYYNVNSQY